MRGSWSSAPPTFWRAPHARDPASTTGAGHPPIGTGGARSTSRSHEPPVPERIVERHLRRAVNGMQAFFAPDGDRGPSRRRSALEAVADAGGSGRGYGSQAFQTDSWASTQFFAAASGVMPLLVIASATEFWSAFVQLKFLIIVAASPPLVLNLVLMILLSGVSG